MWILGTVSGSERILIDVCRAPCKAGDRETLGRRRLGERVGHFPFRVSCELQGLLSWALSAILD